MKNRQCTYLKGFLQKMNKGKSRKKILVSILTLCLLTVATFAWFITSDSKHNTFKTGDYLFNVTLEDKFPSRLETPINTEIDKEVSAKNTGDLDAFVRLMVFPVATKDGEPLEVNMDEQVTLTGLDKDSWMYGGDGYYYYLHKLAPKKSTPMLFEQVKLTIPDDKKEVYKNAKFDIVAKTEAIHVDKDDYRLSWWGSIGDQTEDPLKTIDETLQEFVH